MKHRIALDKIIDVLDDWFPEHSQDTLTRIANQIIDNLANDSVSRVSITDDDESKIFESINLVCSILDDLDDTKLPAHCLSHYYKSLRFVRAIRQHLSSKKLKYGSSKRK